MRPDESHEPLDQPRLVVMVTSIEKNTLTGINGAGAASGRISVLMQSSGCHAVSRAGFLSGFLLCDLFDLAAAFAR